MFRIQKFRDSVELEHYLNGGILGPGPKPNETFDVVGKTLVFAKPTAFTVTFTSVGGKPRLEFNEVVAQIAAQSSNGVIAFQINQKLALRQAVPAPGGGIHITGGTARPFLGFSAATAVRGLVYNHADGVTAPTLPFLISVYACGVDHCAAVME